MQPWLQPSPPCLTMISCRNLTLSDGSTTFSTYHLLIRLLKIEDFGLLSLTLMPRLPLRLNLRSKRNSNIKHRRKKQKRMMGKGLLLRKVAPRLLKARVELNLKKSRRSNSLSNSRNSNNLKVVLNPKRVKPMTSQTFQSLTLELEELLRSGRTPTLRTFTTKKLISETVRSDQLHLDCRSRFLLKSLRTNWS